MFSRFALEVVLIVKSAIKLKGTPWKHVDSVLPVCGSRMLVTCAMLTSLAVQFSFCFCTKLYSFCKQTFCANAGTARIASASSTKTNVLQQFVRQLIFPPQKIGLRGGAGSGYHVPGMPAYWARSILGVG